MAVVCERGRRMRLLKEGEPSRMTMIIIEKNVVTRDVVKVRNERKFGGEK